MRRPPSEEVLDDERQLELHSSMFGDVRDWTGAYRRVQTSIGIDPALISASA
jgi:fido (protein-threonine AMPylation protein)